MGREAGKRGKGKVTNAEGTSRTIAADNGSRGGLIVSNGHAEKVAWLCLGETAVSEEGIYLAPKTTIIIPGEYSGIVTAIGSPNITYAEF